jgi:hypothetical protein
MVVGYIATPGRVLPEHSPINRNTTKRKTKRASRIVGIGVLGLFDALNHLCFSACPLVRISNRSFVCNNYTILEVPRVID